MGAWNDRGGPIARAVDHLCRVDEVIARLAGEHGPPGFPGAYTPFEAMVRSILSQQISGAAAQTIIGRVERLAGGLTSHGNLAELTEVDLRSCGVSSQKARYISSLIDHIEQGMIDFDAIGELDDVEVIDRLTAVTGVGVWTAKMFLIFNLGRLDVLPHEDLGVRKGMMQVYGLATLPGKREIEQIVEERNWSPYRSVASWYMWRATES